MTHDQETLKSVWERLATEAGVDLLLHRWATAVRTDEGRVSGERVWNKGGERPRSSLGGRATSSE